MTHEEQVRLLEDIRNEEFSTNEVLTRVVLALPVTDAPLVAETTVPPPSRDELREAVGELLDMIERWPIVPDSPLYPIIARVRTALGKGKV